MYGKRERERGREQTSPGGILQNFGRNLTCFDIRETKIQYLCKNFASIRAASTYTFVVGYKMSFFKMTRCLSFYLPHSWFPLYFAREGGIPNGIYNPYIQWEPWSCGYGRRLMFQRSWVRILVPYTGCTWHFFTLIGCKNCIVCLKRPKINEKETGIAPFFNNKKLLYPMWPDVGIIGCTFSKSCDIAVFTSKLVY